VTDQTTPQPGGWHPDPFNRYELRWWDGQQWTEHVSTQGVAQLDPPVATAVVPSSGATAADVQRQVQVQAGAVAAWQGSGHLFDEPVLVVNQKAKFIELENEYGIYDHTGRHLGGVRQVGQGQAKKVLRALTSLDQFMTHNLQVVDASGQVMLSLTRPSKVMKSRILVKAPAGHDVGQIVQQNVFGKIRFSLEANGQTWGSINAENWRAWNFRIDDHAGTEIARITKTWEGVAKAMFTTADNYVIHIHRRLDDPLRSLVIASAVSIDTALKQDAQGFN